MSASISVVMLSGAANGLDIKVAATSSPGTTIHTAVAGVAAQDEIWLWATNTDTVARLLTIQWGGTTAPDNSISVTVPAQAGEWLVIPGRRLQNGLVVKAFAAAANVILIGGNVDRITN